MLSLFIPSFIAGLLTFLAPCTLPLVPAYLAFISGTSAGKRQVFQNALFFVIGFSVVFISFGLFAGFLGGLLFEFRIWMSRIGGLFIVLFGLFSLGALNNSIFCRREKIFRSVAFHAGNVSEFAYSRNHIWRRMDAVRRVGLGLRAFFGIADRNSFVRCGTARCLFFRACRPFSFNCCER